jgi:hypothetical protein
VSLQRRGISHGNSGGLFLAKAMAKGCLQIGEIGKSEIFESGVDGSDGFIVTFTLAAVFIASLEEHENPHLFAHRGKRAYCVCMASVSLPLLLRRDSSETFLLAYGNSMSASTNPWESTSESFRESSRSGGTSAPDTIL